jgi:hypothetical protein
VDLDIILDENDPKIKIPTNLKAPTEKVTEEGSIEEKCCHGEEIGVQLDTIDNDMFSKGFWLVMLLIASAI